MNLFGKKITTLGEFILEKQADFPYATGELSSLLTHIAIAAKIVNREVNKAGLVDILGETGEVNVQGETVKKLDIYANEQFIAALKASEQCCGVGSEENDDFLSFSNPENIDAKYVVAMDPLDGSSNIDVNVSIGTIFSIYRRLSDSGAATEDDILQKGEKQVAAGYIIYGSSTILVYSTGKGVNGFTLDPSIGEFCLSHPKISTPKEGKIYSINLGNMASFPKSIVNYIDYCHEVDKATKRPYSLRYIGSAVADIHRNLLKGGIFIYPPTSKSPNGKLRLLYECNPLAFLIKHAGGSATDGSRDILSIQPKKLHQRTPLYLGSKNMVNQVERFIKTPEFV